MFNEIQSHIIDYEKMKQYKEDFELLCLDFLGELLKFNKRVITQFEITLG
jgi:hypothetical protein